MLFRSRRIDYLNSLFYSNENDKQERLQPVLLEKCKIEDKIKGIKERLLKFNHENCPVCIDKFKMPVASNCCNNIFCMECLLECMKRNSKCPFSHFPKSPPPIPSFTHPIGIYRSRSFQKTPFAMSPRADYFGCYLMTVQNRAKL